MEYKKLRNLSASELRRLYLTLTANGEVLIIEMEKSSITESEKESLLTKHRDLIAYRYEINKQLEKDS